MLDSLSTAHAAELTNTAENLRGAFSTIEDMTKGFIRTAITKGLFAPGQRLQQDALAELLGVSRMPVRAALRQLEAENLITFHPHRGATVRELTADEIGEIYDLRIVLECEIIEVATPQLEEKDLEELERLKGSHEADQHDILLEAEQRREFYSFLCEIAGRPWTQQLLHFLHTALGPYRLLHREGDTHNEHLELVAYLRTGDVDGAKDWLRKHLSERSYELQRLVRSQAEQAAASSN